MRSGWELAWLLVCAIAGVLFALFGIFFLDQPYAGRRRKEKAIEDLLEEWDSQDQLEGDEEDDEA